MTPPLRGVTDVVDATRRPIPLNYPGQAQILLRRFVVDLFSSVVQQVVQQ